MKARLRGIAPWFALLLGVLTAATIILRMTTSNAETTALETSLFSILQFLFSIGFAWVLAQIVSRNEFIRSQRNFAVAAYRRIKEIEKGIERLLSRANYQMKVISNQETLRELEVILALASGIQESIKSSIADWGDVIGEEIGTLQKIEEIETEREDLFSAPHLLEPSAQIRIREQTETILERLDANQETLNRLVLSLPRSLQLQVSSFRAESPLRGRDIDSQVQMLVRKKEEKGYIELSGFWDPSFERDVHEFSVGDRLLVGVYTVGARTNALIAKDDSGSSVGVITNSLGLGLNYEKFTAVIIEYVGKRNFYVEITEMKDLKAPPHDRLYFKAKIVDYALRDTT